MSKYIKIEGIVEINELETHDQFIDAFINFIEENKWFFGGGSKEVNENGEDI